jgi:hypothetical protein
MSELFKFQDVELYWPSLYEVNPTSQKYQVDIVNLNEAQVQKLEGLGIDVKTKDDERGFFVTCKSKYEIVPYNTKGDALERSIKVGNGSRADVLVKPYSWKGPTGNKGVSLGVTKLVVTDLKQYVPEDNLMEEEETL